MFRYKFTEASVDKARKYLKGTVKKGPVWAERFKDDLTLKGKKVFYKTMQIVPKEQVDKLLRDELYKKDGDIPSGRDSAFHIIKQRYFEKRCTTLIKNY